MNGRRPWEAPRLSPLQEVLFLWATCFGAIILAFLVWPAAASLASVAGFLYLPYLFMWRRHEDYRDYGVTLQRWPQDLAHFLLVSAVIAPVYFLGYWGFSRALPLIPPRLAEIITPLTAAHTFHPRLPAGFLKQTVTQVGVVALPEEFFYRGYLQARLKAAWPGGPRFLGVTMGKAFWLTALLFALGHLATFRVWRLWVFFPALVFGWMRERTGTVAGSTAFHAACNLFEQFLEASFD